MHNPIDRVINLEGFPTSLSRSENDNYSESNNPNQVLLPITDNLEFNYQIPGHEYDELVSKYENALINNPVIRYKRDFEGFTGEYKSTINLDDISGDDDQDIDWFIRHMKRYPLLDGLAHERILRNKLEEGLQAERILSTIDISTEETTINKLKDTAAIGAGAFLTMYECNLRLVYSYAKKYSTSSSFSRADSIQEGCIGLRRGIQKYIPDKGYKLSTYATVWIKQAISIAQAESRYEVRFSPKMHDKAKHIRKFIDQVLENGKSEPNDQELVEAGFSIDDVKIVYNFFYNNRISLDAPLNSESDGTLYNKLQKEQLSESRIDSDQILNYLEKLSIEINLEPKDLTMFLLRHGILADDPFVDNKFSSGAVNTKKLKELVTKIKNTGENAMLDEIGQVYNLSRERVRQRNTDTFSKILRNLSISRLAITLNLDDLELNDFNTYFFNVAKKSKRTSTNKFNDKITAAKNVINLLSLSDADIDKVLAEAATIIKLNFNLADSRATKIINWVNDRFDIKDADSLPPYKVISSKDYGIDKTSACLGDAVVLALIAKVWGSSIEELYNFLED